MYKLSQAVTLPLRIVLRTSCVFLLLLISMMNASYAGGDHDHGHGHDDEATAPAIAAHPRLTMESSQFELVGILQGKELHLYLDDYSTNKPINTATIELEMAGERLQAKTKAEGGYRVELKTELKEGVYPILVTVITDQSTDLLIGELDVHHDDKDVKKAEEKVSPLSLMTQSIHPSWIVLISLPLLLILGFVLWRDRQKKRMAE